MTNNTSSLGKKITFDAAGKLQVPDNPIILYIEGDGTGPDIWQATVRVLDAAVAKAYGGKKQHRLAGNLGRVKRLTKPAAVISPMATLTAIKEYLVALKGPLTTPVGGGFRSINVTLRQVLDLYACIRPVRYYAGTPSPLKEPEKTNMVVFRENTEDVYAGIEWPATSPEARKVVDFLNNQMGCRISPESGIGIKPMSAAGSQRLVRKAINVCPANQPTQRHLDAQRQYYEIYRRAPLKPGAMNWPRRNFRTRSSPKISSGRNTTAGFRPAKSLSRTASPIPSFSRSSCVPKNTVSSPLPI